MLPRRKKETIDFIPITKSSNSTTFSDEIDQTTTTTTTTRENPDESIGFYSSSRLRSTAEQVSNEIQSDKIECCRIIEEFGVDEFDLISLLDDWTQNMLTNFRNDKDKFGIILKDKWEKGELISNQNEEKFNEKLLFAHREKLIRWKQTKYSSTNKDNEENLLLSKNLKEFVRRSIEELIDLIESMKFIEDIHLKDFQRIHSNRISTKYRLDETFEHLNRLKQLNSKEFNSICIIGLEKAGKSSFINALIGFELLPFRIERCTQLQTILKPIDPDQEDLYGSIEFYDFDQFNRLINEIPQRNDENFDEFQRRLTKIRQTRENLVRNECLYRHLTAKDDFERKQTREKLHEFIADEIYLSIVKHVVIYTNRLVGSNYILLDVPGCDSPIREHYQSSLSAIRTADAFLFLTDGQRPSLTKQQIELLDEIQRGHFDGMKRAFGIITKLDLCPTLNKFEEHRRKTREELLSKHFLDENIFCVAANFSLLQQTNSDSETLKTIEQRIQSYSSLIDGFQQCKNALNRFIEHQLPYSRYRQIQQIENEKIFSFVKDSIDLINEIFPEEVNRQTFDDYLKQINAQKWNQIFENERFRPTFSRSIRWQKEHLVLQRKQTAQTMKHFFSQRFRFHSEIFRNEIHPIEDSLLEKFDISPTQINPYDIDIRQREYIVDKLLNIIHLTSNDLVSFIYQTYLLGLENLLNEISSEWQNLYQNPTKFDHYAIELKAFIVRTTKPLIFAVVYHPRALQDIRKESIKEFIRHSPLVAFQLVDRQNKLTNQNEKFFFTQSIENLLEEFKTKSQENSLLFAIFRR